MLCTGSVAGYPAVWTSVVQTTSWIDVDLLHGWTNLSVDFGIRIVAGQIQLRGILLLPLDVTGQKAIFGQLPTNCWPPSDIDFTCPATPGTCLIEIRSNGKAAFVNPIAPISVDISNIKYTPAP